MNRNSLLVNPLPRVETKTLHGLTGCWDVLISLAKFAGGAVFYSVSKTRKKFHEISVEISVAVFDEKNRKCGASWGQTLGEEHGSSIARQKLFTGSKNGFGVSSDFLGVPNWAWMSLAGLLDELGWAGLGLAGGTKEFGFDNIDIDR